MKFKEFNKEYGGLSRNEIMGLINTHLLNSGKEVGDLTIQKYGRTLKRLNNNEYLFNDLVNGLQDQELKEKYNLSGNTIQMYKTPLRLVGIIPSQNKYIAKEVKEPDIFNSKTLEFSANYSKGSRGIVVSSIPIGAEQKVHVAMKPKFNEIWECWDTYISKRGVSGKKIVIPKTILNEMNIKDGDTLEVLIQKK